MMTLRIRTINTKDQRKTVDLVESRGKSVDRTVQCKRYCTWAVVALLLGGARSLTAQMIPSGVQWVGTWSSVPVEADLKNTFSHQTIRQIVHTSVGGERARIQISNLFGIHPVRIEEIHIALRSTGSSIVPGSDRQIRFGGQPFVIVQPGQAVASDAVAFPIARLADMAISFYLPEPTTSATFHPSAHQTSYISPGNVSSSEHLSEVRTTGSCYFVTNLDVQGRDLRGSVVTLGASITEGYTSTQDTNRRWPDVLARRLADAGLNVGVLNQGISGNRLLADGAGPDARARFDRDVLAQPGVRWVIFSDDPINDLGSTKPPPSANELIAGIQELISRAHQKQILFLCSTLTPYQGANYWTEQGETAREQVNAFLRSSRSGCDALVDQDAATHDPALPPRYRSAYDIGDHLHPNDAGQQAIANAVDLSIFKQSASGRDK